MSKGLPTGFTGCADGGASILHWGQGEINRPRFQVIPLLGNMFLTISWSQERQTSAVNFINPPLTIKTLSHNTKKLLAHYASTSIWQKANFSNKCMSYMIQKNTKRCLVEVGLIKTLIKMYKTEFLNSSTCCALIKRASEANFTHNMDIILHTLAKKSLYFNLAILNILIKCCFSHFCQCCWCNYILKRSSV